MMDGPGGYGGGAYDQKVEQFNKAGEDKQRKDALLEAQKKQAQLVKDALNMRLKQRALARNKLTGFTEGTTLSRPLTGGNRQQAQSLFSSENGLPSLLGDM
jgi:hypothetical protein